MSSEPIIEPSNLLPDHSDLPSTEPPVRFRQLTRKTQLLALALAILTISSGSALYYYFNVVQNKRPATIAVLNSQGSVSLGLSPATMSGNVNDTVTLELIANSGSEHLSAVGAILTYNPSQLEVTEVHVGSVLPTQLSAPNINASTGRVTFDLGAPASSGGVTGQNTIATLSVRVKAAGTLSVSADSLAYTTEHTDNILRTATSTTISLASASPNPSNSPSPSPSPSTAASANPSPSVSVSSPTPPPTVRSTATATPKPSLKPSPTPRSTPQATVTPTPRSTPAAASPTLAPTNFGRTVGEVAQTQPTSSIPAYPTPTTSKESTKVGFFTWLITQIGKLFGR